MLSRLTLLLALTACTREPDLETLCEKTVRCEGGSVVDCLAKRRKLYGGQQRQGCGAEGAALVACEVAHGECQSAARLTMFMPTEACRRELNALFECFGRAAR